MFLTECSGQNDKQIDEINNFRYEEVMGYYEQTHNFGFDGEERVLCI